MTAVPNVETALRTFAAQITAKFNLSGYVSFQPEDQLKSPVEELIKAVGGVLGLAVQVVTEVHAEDAGRPDIGVTQQGLLTGHIELKAPGKGADVRRLKDHDRRQWEKFKDFPNLIYTDGNEWTLYRTGDRVKSVSFRGDVCKDGANAADASVAQAFLDLMRDFLRWEPLAPRNPKALAALLGPLCRLLRDDVQRALQHLDSDLSVLAQDWRSALFPHANDAQFADAYAQTLTYALLLARLEGVEDLTVDAATRTLRHGHQLLAEALKVLGDDAARIQIAGSIDLMERVIRAVEPAILMRPGQEDPWLYFYEDFLAVYDSRLRKDYGVYYTPVEVVQAQIRLVGELLATRFGADKTFAQEGVVTLDPAVGTGTYILAAVQHGLDSAAALRGPGARKQAATDAAQNIHAFEFLVGPYTVAHLRLTQQIVAEGGEMPPEGVHVYLADTLESPYAEPPTRLALVLRRLGEEHKRAQQVKASTSVLVCIGNPPYNREQRDEETPTSERKGGWVRFGDGVDAHQNRVRFDDTDGKRVERPPLLYDFLAPLGPTGLGVHAKNLYNDYVYFWRWTLWKVFETKSDGGIVSFITAASYLRGPGFAGMRQVMRQTFDELYLIDLEGDNLGARKTENVFAIQTPVCIAIGVRKGAAKPDVPAHVRYARLEGSRSQKLEALANITSFDSLTWRDCSTSWHDPFLPRPDTDYQVWPLLTNLFPWQENGVQFGRSWPIGESQELLQLRWNTLVSADNQNKTRLFGSANMRPIYKTYPSLEKGVSLPALTSLKSGSASIKPMRYAFRSFDRHWILPDNRVCHRLRPTLMLSQSEHQIFLTSFLTEVLGEGPAAIATALVPDFHHFRGSFGGAHVIPLWRDVDGTDANVTDGTLAVLTSTYGYKITAEDIFAYAYAILASPDYVHRFWEELRTPGPRLPTTRDRMLFARAAALGRELLWLHTFGERFVPTGQRPGRLPKGQAQIQVGTSGSSEGYPETFRYNEKEQTILVGEGEHAGVFARVRPDVWNYSVSGLQVVKSWLGYRMKKRKGKKSSSLDDIRPRTWTFDDELLDLLWLLDATIDRLPQTSALLEEILTGELFTASDFPQPTQTERRGPRLSAALEEQITLELLEDEWFTEEDDPEVAEEEAA